MMNDRIEKRIELKAPISRVWRAVTDYREFGEWFRVKLDGPFVPGQVSRGQITYPGYEQGDHSKDPTTLVEFRLEKTATGTLLVLTESGFDNIPGDFRLEAFRRNEGGWAEQMRNIERYVAKAA